MTNNALSYMQRTDPLSTISVSEFQTMIDRRSRRIAEILDVPPHPGGVFPLFTENQHLFIMVTLDYPLDVFAVFADTNSSIGEDWLWDNRTFYFVRETDATWFRLRWT